MTPRAEPSPMRAIFYPVLAPRVLLLDRKGNVLQKSASLAHEPAGRDNRVTGPCPPTWSARDRAELSALLADIARDERAEIERTWLSEGEEHPIEWSAAALACAGAVDRILLTGMERVREVPFTPASGRARPASLLVETRFPMWVIDRRTCQLLAANDAALTMLGYERGALLSRRLHHLVRREEVPSLLGALVRVRPGIETRDFWRLYRADGEDLDAEVQMLPVNASGVPACAVLSRALKPS